MGHVGTNIKGQVGIMYNY